MTDLTFSVTGRSENAARLVAEARQFRLVIDEPPSLGGEDRGPNPVEYLLAAFIGCINVVAHLTAREMGLDLHHLEITATGALNPARLFGDTTADRVGFKTIEVVVRADTDADSPTLERWLDTVKTRCPVSDNLANPTPVTLVHQPWPR
jgi:uncharacterized OsmC-like protein